MSTEESLILSSDLGSENGGENGPNIDQPPRSPYRKILLLISFLVIFIIIIISVIWWLGLSNRKTKINKQSVVPVQADKLSSSTPSTLPDLNTLNKINASSTVATSSDLSLEYLSFSNFYKAPNNSIDFDVNTYKLPLNVKVDVMNYYDVSRKLDLDPSLDSLNENGFGIINNPWLETAPDFYSVYNNLSSHQLPTMITSDFLIYYYQNIYKKLFKDVEENVFYNNLWDINKKMYTVAKNRYEAHLAQIGDVNDPILEGERLETAFFAVALELLKPAPEQLAAKGVVDRKDLFVASDADHFYFVVPPYLRDDVLAELKLIREAKTAKKSPVLLYQRDYSKFIVPSDYVSQAKLNNFYLTSKWLNSIFPLNYRDKSCPKCLLDKADWRVNLTAASLIARDFSDLSLVKNKWARIYKIMAFFKGLRSELDYVYYRDALTSLFGKDYNIGDIFSDKNSNALTNLEKLRAKLQEHNFSEVTGAPADKMQNIIESGFRMLAESYWPNDYIFKNLMIPVVTNYQGTSTKAYNITACKNKTSKKIQRCNGIALDIVNLVYPIANNSYFAENTNYSNYNLASRRLRKNLENNVIWHSNNYWTTLSSLKSYLNVSEDDLPVFARSKSWQNRKLDTAVSSWINLQLPLEKFSVAPVYKGKSLNNFSHWNSNVYVEPNLSLINELLANNKMVLKMFSALQLDDDVHFALQSMRDFNSSIEILKDIVIKELKGKTLSEDDNKYIVDFVKRLKISTSPLLNKELDIKISNSRRVLREDLSKLKLLIIVHQEGDNKIFSVGPIWDYQEKR